MATALHSQFRALVEHSLVLAYVRGTYLLHNSVATTKSFTSPPLPLFFPHPRAALVPRRGDKGKNKGRGGEVK